MVDMSSDDGWKLVGFISAGALAGVGGAMGWFRLEKNKLIARMDLFDEMLNSEDRSHAQHRERLAVMESVQKNVERQLTDIKETTGEMNKTLSTVLIELVKANGK